MSGTNYEKQIILYRTNMIKTSFKNSILLFETRLYGTAPAIITAAMIEKAFNMTWKIKWSLNTTTIMAIKNLLNKKYIGWIREIGPWSSLRSSKIVSYRSIEVFNRLLFQSYTRTIRIKTGYAINTTNARKQLAVSIISPVDPKLIL